MATYSLLHKGAKLCWWLDWILYISVTPWVNERSIAMLFYLNTILSLSIIKQIKLNRISMGLLCGKYLAEPLTAHTVVVVLSCFTSVAFGDICLVTCKMPSYSTARQVLYNAPFSAAVEIRVIHFWLIVVLSITALLYLMNVPVRLLIFVSDTYPKLGSEYALIWSSFLHLVLVYMLAYHSSTEQAVRWQYVMFMIVLDYLRLSTCGHISTKLHL